MATLIADRRLCLTADRGEVVEENDVRAAWLLVGAGKQIGEGDVARYKLSMVGGRVMIGRAAAKAAREHEDKMASAPEDKGAAEDVDVGDGSDDDLPDDMPGRAALVDAGYFTLDTVVDASDDELGEVQGIGRATVKKIRAYLEGRESE